MKNKLLVFGLLATLLIISCKKETIIVQKYNPPSPLLYGTWELLETDTNRQSFYVFLNDGSNFGYGLEVDKNGFKAKNGFAFQATNNQLILGSSIINYSVAGDTLKLLEDPSIPTLLVRVPSPAFTPSTWVTDLKILKRIELPRGVNYNTMRPFGIDGDNLYLCGYNGINYYVYKFNSLTKEYSDSIAVPNVATTFFKSPTMYYGFDGSEKIHKTTGLTAPLVAISNNFLNYTNSISYNASSGVVYAFSNVVLYAGTENSNFNTLLDFNPYGISYIQYDKNDQFLGVQNGAIRKIKISPKFSVVENYDRIQNSYTYFVSSNGTDHWAFIYNYPTDTYQLVKVNLN